jgi:hypothetical protein
MDTARKNAYRLVLAAGLLHLKWDLACVLNGFGWLSPRRVMLQVRAMRRAAARAYAFHNLAIFSTQEFHGFDEGMFWGDIEKFDRKSATDPSNYRLIFERCLRGEEVNIVSPNGIGGGQSTLNGRISPASQH